MQLCRRVCSPVTRERRKRKKDVRHMTHAFPEREATSDPVDLLGLRSRHQIGICRVTGSPPKKYWKFSIWHSREHEIENDPARFSAQAFCNPAAPFLAVVVFTGKKEPMCLTKGFDVRFERMPTQVIKNQRCTPVRSGIRSI
jgi:hypothetical protein